MCKLQTFKPWLLVVVVVKVDVVEDVDVCEVDVAVCVVTVDVAFNLQLLSGYILRLGLLVYAQDLGSSQSL